MARASGGMSLVMFLAMVLYMTLCATPAATTTDCCSPDGTFHCQGSCFVGGLNANDEIAFPTETNTLFTIPNSIFVRNHVQGLNNTQETSFKEVEVFTQVPNDCNHLTGVTFNRTDVIGAIGQVVMEDLYFKDNCSSFVKIVRGQQNPGPVLCHVNCTKQPEQQQERQQYLT
eukprot:m.259111 g.259111  ORF g.259111 m.259111 type:complete len:172 (+) comp37595_c0_seq1:41-556(+)